MTVTLAYDVVVYGGWAGNGISEALAAKRESTYATNVRVALVSEGPWVGGMLCQGLTDADIGNALLMSGLYRDIFITETAEFYGAYKDYDYEPRVGQSIVMRQMAAAGIDVFVEYPITAATMTGTNVDSITCDAAIEETIFTATVFIDASIEGDLMALCMAQADITDIAAGGGWCVGTESSVEYSELMAGYNRNPFYYDIDPYETPGNLWPQITAPPALAVGDAYEGIQAYAYRMVLSNQAGNKRAWSTTYDAAELGLESLLRPADTDFRPGGIAPGIFGLNDNIYLTNTDAGIGTVGTPVHWHWPTGTPAVRRQIETLIADWQEAKYSYFALDPARAGVYQSGDADGQGGIANFGKALNGYVGNAIAPYFPHQIYSREGRRLVGQYVVCQQDTQEVDPAEPRSTTKTDSVGVGGYSLDIKPAAFYTDGASTVRFLAEGSGNTPDPEDRLVNDDGYAIPYTAILPQAAYTTNLFVTYCASFSHVAWGSYRILWQPFQMGEAAGCAAGYCVVNSIAINALDVSTLRAKLRDDYNCIVDPIRRDNTYYYLNARRQNKGNTYICVQAGTTDDGAGPIGTGSNIVDGTVLWDYTAT
jgi:hypothetical protein